MITIFDSELVLPSGPNNPNHFKAGMAPKKLVERQLSPRRLVAAF